PRQLHPFPTRRSSDLGEPEAGALNYQRFVRAKELTVQRSVTSLAQAKHLYWICLAENPAFAPAWAWLGRCCWQLAKLGRGPSTEDRKSTRLNSSHDQT